MASGIPCLTNEGVGDMAAILLEGGAGKTLGELSDSSIRAGVNGLITLTQQCCKLTVSSLQFGLVAVW